MKIVIWLIAVIALFMTGHYFWMISLVLGTVLVWIWRAEGRSIARRDGDIDFTITKKEERELQKYLDSVEERGANEVDKIFEKISVEFGSAPKDTPKN